MERKALVGGTVIDGTGKPPFSGPWSPFAVTGSTTTFVMPPAALRWNGEDRRDREMDTARPGRMPHLHRRPCGRCLCLVQGPRRGLDSWMREHLQHGVRTVRDTGNYDPDETHNLAKQEKPEWPRFFGAGPVHDGLGDPPAPGRWLWVLEDEKWVKPARRAQSARGLRADSNRGDCGGNRPGRRGNQSAGGARNRGETKLADLLVLEADPLQDIGNTRRIWGVFKSCQLVHGHATTMVA